MTDLIVPIGKSKDTKKADLKDKYARFYDALEEAEQRHRSARVLPEDDDGREMLEDEVCSFPRRDLSFHPFHPW